MKYLASLIVSAAVLILTCVFGVYVGFWLKPLGQWWLGEFTWVMGLVMSLITFAMDFGAIFGVGALLEKEAEKPERDQAKQLLPQISYVPIGTFVGTLVALVAGNIIFTIIFTLLGIMGAIRSLSHVPITQSEWLAISTWNLATFIFGVILSFLAGFIAMFLAMGLLSTIVERDKKA